MKKKIKVNGKNPLLLMASKSRVYEGRRPVRISKKPTSMGIVGPIEGEGGRR